MKHRCARVLSVSGLSLCLLCAAPPQAVAPQGNSEALFVCLGALASPSEVQLDGFKSRALRSAEALPQRHLYVTMWHHVEVSCGAGAAVLVIGDWTSACCQACVVKGSDVTRPLAAVVVPSATGGDRCTLPASLSALECALVLAQLQLSTMAVPKVWLLMSACSYDAGALGMSRSARTEASMPLACIDAAVSVALTIGLSVAEPEAMLRKLCSYAPRLQSAPTGSIGPMRLHYHSRGALSNLVGEPQSPLQIFSVVTMVETGMGREGAHVVTGGTGGLGLLTGRWLAQTGTRVLVLASRSGVLAKGTGAEWEAMQASGASPLIERCDAAEAAHITRLVAGAPSLSGVWHAAGVLADAVLAHQSAPGLARVFAPKADGAWSLHTASAATSVHTFALFSSVAALLGGAGQANYAAANACLDALATCRRTRGIASVSVQWGAWAEIGMAARGVASARMVAIEEASGMSRIRLAQGVRALGTAMQHSSSPVLAMIPVRWSRFLGIEAPAFLSALFSPPTCACSPVGAVAHASPAQASCGT